MEINQAPLDEEFAWAEIAGADDKLQQYFKWCCSVIAARVTNEISMSDAAAMIGPRHEMSVFTQLQQSADAQIVLDFASSIADGGAYIGAEGSMQRDWDSIVDIVNRHSL